MVQVSEQLGREIFSYAVEEAQHSIYMCRGIKDKTQRRHCLQVEIKGKMLLLSLAIVNG